MIRKLFEGYAVAAIVSPWAFLVGKLTGLFNFAHDWLVLAGLFFGSVVVLFLFCVMILLVKEGR